MEFQIKNRGRSVKTPPPDNTNRNRSRCLLPGRDVLQLAGGLSDLLGRIRERPVFVAPGLGRCEVILIITHGERGVGIGTVLIVTGTRMGIELGRSQRLDGGVTGVSPALAVGGPVGGQFEGQFAATLVIEVGPGGGTAQRLQVGTVADTVDENNEAPKISLRQSSSPEELLLQKDEILNSEQDH